MKRTRLDSDDDDDEIDTTHLTHYATAALNQDTLLDMGLVSSSSSTVSEKEDNEYNGDGEAPASGEGTTKAPLVHPNKAHLEKPSVFNSSVLPEDKDVPYEWRSLLSEDLLQVYACPLSYFSSHKRVDEKLIAQYRLYDESKVTFDRADNGLPIAPGGRWDGIVRGRAAKLQ